jgi:hypothetical protein
MKNFFKLNLPHIIAIVAFAMLTYLFFSPLIEGKKIKQQDVMQWEGAAKEIIDHREATGEEPLWTNSMFSGMPAFQISVLYPNNLYHHLYQVISAPFPSPSFIIFLALLTFYFLLISFGLPPLAGAAGAIAFAFSSYNVVVIEAGHNTKGLAIGYMALILLGVLLAFRRKYLSGAALATAGIALQLYSNHLQITYYLVLTLILLGIAQTVNAFVEKDFKHYFKALGILVFAAILAIMPNITQLWVTAEYGQETTRGKSELTIEQDEKTGGLDLDYITGWSYGIAETWTLMIPNFKGGGSGAIGAGNPAMESVDPQMRQFVSGMDQYFGAQPGTSGPVYVGAIICFLFILGLFFVDGYIKWWLLSATVLSILLSWGKNFMPFTEFFVNNIPGYDKFRAVSMTLVIAQITMPLLGFLAVKKVLDVPEILKEKQAQFLTALGLTGGISFLMYLFPGLVNDFYKPEEVESLLAQTSQAGWPNDQSNMLIYGLEQARMAIFKSDAIRSAIFIFLAGLAVWAYSRKIVKPVMFSGILLLLVLADMWTVGKRYINEDSFTSKVQKQAFQPTSADLQIMQDKDVFRVYNASVSTFNDASTSYFHHSIGGYHGAKLKRYQELISNQISKNNMSVLNMLNTRYFIVPGQENQPPMPQRNPEALGNAWFVNDYQLVANADSEMIAITEFDPSSLAVVDQRFSHILNGFKPVKDDGGSIKLASYQPNKLIYDFSAATEQLVVFSEIYYDKGWKAFIDGEPADHFRVNYVLRAMRIPQGNHNIEFRFEPSSYQIGEYIALVGSILSILFIGFAVYSELKTNKPVVEKEA